MLVVQALLNKLSAPVFISAPVLIFKWFCCLKSYFSITLDDFIIVVFFRVRDHALNITHVGKTKTKLILQD